MPSMAAPQEHEISGICSQYDRSPGGGFVPRDHTKVLAPGLCGHFMFLALLGGLAMVGKVACGIAFGRVHHLMFGALLGRLSVVGKVACRIDQRKV